ncbi:MAG: hypothetical protein IT209_04575 [Armatimonadetes bacterium]|nr:hypothetical protein [Armatimonadota bacterium]
MLDKLTKLQVIIVGVVLSLIIGVGMFFLLVRPRMEKFTQVDKQRQEVVAKAAELPLRQRELEQAERDRLQAQLDYRKYELSKMPEISFADRTQGMIALWREHAEVLGPMLENWPRRFGVEMGSTVSIPAATTNPNNLQDGLMKIHIGSISVQGDFYDIMRSIEGWNRFGRLVQVGPVTLSGVSPNLTGSYDLTVLWFPRGTAGAQVAMAPAAGAQDQQAGMAGGAPMPPPASPMGAQPAPVMTPPAPQMAQPGAPVPPAP